MNRTIKFRGMDVNGVMRYGQLSQDKPNSTAYYDRCSQRICWDNSNIPVTNKTLGQFTGLHDKNGKEIYEGDIVSPVEGLKSEVFWWDNHARFACRNKKNRNFPLYLINQQEVEIIGNIYENPELIK